MSACRHEASAFACATRGSCESLMTCMLQTSMEVPFFRRQGGGPISTPVTWGQLPELMQGCLVSVGVDEVRYQEVASSDWSGEWHGWRDVHGSMNDASIMAWTRRFLRVATQNTNVGCRDNPTRLMELQREGLWLVAADGDGNNCLINALILSMASQGILPGYLLTCSSSRRNACAACRESFVRSDRVALRPQQRSGLGRPLSVSEAEHARAFLEAETHGPAAVQFLLHHFGRAQTSRSTTFMIVVYTRFDCANLNPLNMATIVGDWQPGHATVVLRLYNQMDARGQGYHFDALVEDSTVANVQKSESPVHVGMPEVAEHVDKPNKAASPDRVDVRSVLVAFLRARGAGELHVAASDVERVAAAWNRREDLAEILMTLMQAELVFSDSTWVCGRRLAAEFRGFAATYCAGPGRKLGSGESSTPKGSTSGGTRVRSPGCAEPAEVTMAEQICSSSSSEAGDQMDVDEPRIAKQPLGQVAPGWLGPALEEFIRLRCFQEIPPGWPSYLR